MTKKEMEIVKFDENQLTSVELELFQMSKDILSQYDGLRGKYVKIFTFVRSNQIPPDRCDLIFEAAGFNRQRASEMRRICATDDETARNYSAGKIGFKAVLEIEREKKPAKVTLRNKTRKSSYDKMFHQFLKVVKSGSARPFLGVSGDMAVLVFPLVGLDKPVKAATGHVVTEVLTTAPKTK